MFKNTGHSLNKSRIFRIFVFYKRNSYPTMIHYNPTEHHDIIVFELKRCFTEERDFSRPISPTPKSGECYIIAFNKTYCIDEEALSKLEEEAHLRWKEDTQIRFAKELAVPLEDVKHLVEYAYFIKVFSLSDSKKIRASLFNSPCKDADTDLVAELSKIRPQGGTSCLHHKHLPYYLRGKTEKK
jgi:hypothetical protein